MQTTLRVLKVFLASPDDVKSERAAAEMLVNGINKHLSGTLGWHIHLYKWEDAVPAYGRAQELINEAVDDCTLFVGLLWERWGQPTGKYSSGFEEEYERALARRKKADEPEIWLVFKAPNPEKVKDPGAELSKVLEFRKAVGAAREILYREVADCDDWKTRLHDWLWDNVVKRDKAAAQTVQPQQPTPASQLEPPDPSTGNGEVSNQLLQTAASLTRVIKSGELEFTRQETNILQEFDVARLFLLSATWMSRRYTNDTIGIHEMNLLYKNREQLEPTATECLQMFRSILADTSGVIPGWFWFVAMGPETVRDQLVALATRDSSSEVRRRALRLLRDAGMTLPETLWTELPLSDDEETVRAEAYQYLASVANENILPFLESNIDVEEAGSKVREARLSILLRLRPKEAFTELIETGQYVSDETIGKLKNLAAGFDDEILLKGAENQWEQLRKFSLEELWRRGRFPKDLAQKLIEDPSASIRELAFKELARQGQTLEFKRVRDSLSGEKPSQPNYFAAMANLYGGGTTGDRADADSVILTFYRHQSPAKALEAVDWFGLDGVLAYKGLAMYHYDAVRNDLRSDLENGFKRVRQQSIASIESMLGTEYAKNFVEGFKKLDDFVLSQFVEAALVGLAANGQPSDVRFGRQYLASDDSATKLAAVRIVSKFGTAEDVPALLQVSREHWGEARDEAGTAALRLSSNPLEVALELTVSNSPTLVRNGYGWLYKQGSPEVDKFFEALMGSESDIGRLRALYYFSRNRTWRDLEGMLEAQLNRETYYYNVVTWLDRLLYSPAPLREFFTRDLEKQAS
jgi:HEAT repeat protein